jgi:hypothetical protein
MKMLMVKANARVAVVYCSVVAGLIGLLSASTASAQTACDVDRDCPGTACGTQVCVKSSGGSACMDANPGMSGISDGWCNVDSDCKCHSLGAVCSSVFCSFTVAPDGGTTGTGGGSGGSTGTGGSGTGTGGSTGSAGTSGGGGGCSIAGPPSLGSVAGFAFLAAALLRRRSRRRA